MMRVSRWLGKLLAPADDPRRGVADGLAAPLDAEALLPELRRSRRELAELRAAIEARAPGSSIAQQLADEEHELDEAEAALLLSLDEQRARAALLRAADARIRAER